MEGKGFSKNKTNKIKTKSKSQPIHKQNPFTIHFDFLLASAMIPMPPQAFPRLKNSKINKRVNGKAYQLATFIHLSTYVEGHILQYLP